MTPSYKRDMNHSYLVLEEQPMNSGQYHQMKMITENEIMGLLKTTIHTFNGENMLYYRISGMQSLKCLYEKKEMQSEDFMLLLQGMQAVLKNMDAYFLEETYLLLSLEYIYINVSKKEILFCLYPCEETNPHQAFQKLAEELLNCIDYQDEKAVFLAYRLYRDTREDTYHFLSVLEEIIQGEVIEQAAPSHQESIPKQTFANENNLEEVEDSNQTELTSEKRILIFAGSFKVFLFLFAAGIFYGGYQYVNMAERQAGDLYAVFSSKSMILSIGIITIGLTGMAMIAFYNKLVRGSKRPECVQEKVEEIQIPSEEPYEEDKQTIDETILLKENLYMEERILIGKNKKWMKGESIKIKLDKLPFIIGKIDEMTDFVLDDKSISRVHAKFFIKGQNNNSHQAVYLMDLNSTNGTFKNGIQLDANEAVELYPEDEITFGRITFTYH